MVNVYIVGSKGIPARYGGFETFVENLTKGRQTPNIHYFVSCMSDDNNIFEHNGATCFDIPVPLKNPIGRILHVSKALQWVEQYIKKQEGPNENIVYVLGCRIGPLLKKHHRRLSKLDCKVFCNPDGLEWKRDKWNRFEKKALKLCEAALIKYSDFIVCDSVGIQDYVLKTYPKILKENTTYIAYGAHVERKPEFDDKAKEWLAGKGVSQNGYYLIVGRFVPENNYKIMIREFMASHSKKDLVIISNQEKNAFFKSLKNELHFEKDPRIKFVGTLYDTDILSSVRCGAFGYIHGHSVGGTNPSLLEALACTKFNILFDVPFNREVGRDQCLYFSPEKGSLAKIIDSADEGKINIDFDPKSIIETDFTWESIINKYERLFLGKEQHHA